jgi:hypothetical protein
MYGAIKELVEESNFEIKTEERYRYNLLGKHWLELNTYIVDPLTGETVLLHQYNHTIPKNVPKWLTKHQLWDYTRQELDDLQKLMKINRERKPSKETLRIWRLSVKLDREKRERENVLQSENNSE